MLLHQGKLGRFMFAEQFLFAFGVLRGELGFVFIGKLGGVLLRGFKFRLFLQPVFLPFTALAVQVGRLLRNVLYGA